MSAGAEAGTAREDRWAADPDVRAMLRVRDGDEQAFRELFAKHADPLVNFAFRFVSSRARAEELIQDAFLQIYRARHRYEPRARFVTYLYRVVTNLCLNEVRRYEYQGTFEPLEGPPAPDGSEGFRVLPDEDQPTQDERLEAREAAGRVEGVLKSLPENQRVALLLSRVGGLPYEETAECLETTVSAVKSLIFRATRTLRKELGDLLGGDHEEL